LKSLDPRVTRLPETGEAGVILTKAPLDQLGTFEVFVQPKEGKPFQHEGAIHASDLEMAFVLAKETLTRRFTCTSLYVVDTRSVFVSPYTEGNKNAYELISEIPANTGTLTAYEVYHLTKRGKQHVQAGTVDGITPAHAMAEARKKFGDKVVYNIWVVPTAEIRFTSAEEKDLWLTLPDKKFRDASDYKGGDKLKEFLERST